MNGAADAPFSENTIYVAIELSIAGWLVGLRTSGDGKTALHKLRSGDLDTLLILIGRAAERTRKRLGGDVRILACHEAGRDGFWIHRALTEAGIESMVSTRRASW
jgi:transposase